MDLFLCNLPAQQQRLLPQKLLGDHSTNLLIADQIMDLLECGPLGTVGFAGLQNDLFAGCCVGSCRDTGSLGCADTVFIGEPFRNLQIQAFR